MYLIKSQKKRWFDLSWSKFEASFRTAEHVFGVCQELFRGYDDFRLLGELSSFNGAYLNFSAYTTYTFLSRRWKMKWGVGAGRTTSVANKRTNWTKCRTYIERALILEVSSFHETHNQTPLFFFMIKTNMA